MPTSILPFSFESHQIRTITDENGNFLFVAKDVAEALGYTWTGTQRISHIPEEWRGVTSVVTPSGTQEMAVLAEQGLYFFLARSDKPKALPFQKWIAGEVLPSIRKTGSYAVSATPAEVVLAMAQAMVEIERKQAAQQHLLEEHTQKLKQLDADTGYMTASAWCRKQGIKAPLRFARKLGKLCSKLSKELDIMIGKVADERFGTVNTYHVEVLEEAMEELAEKEKHAKVTKLHEVDGSGDEA